MEEVSAASLLEDASEKPKLNRVNTTLTLPPSGSAPVSLMYTAFVTGKSSETLVEASGAEWQVPESFLREGRWKERNEAGKMPTPQHVEGTEGQVLP